MAKKMYNLKKLFILPLVFCLVLSGCSCGSSAGKQKEDSAVTRSAVSEERSGTSEAVSTETEEKSSAGSQADPFGDTVEEDAAGEFIDTDDASGTSDQSAPQSGTDSQNPSGQAGNTTPAPQNPSGSTTPAPENPSGTENPEPSSTSEISEPASGSGESQAPEEGGFTPGEYIQLPIAP